MESLDHIAAQLQGYDPRALPVDKANAFLAALVNPVAGTQTLPLVQALGRVLAHDVVSPINVPPHDNSAMDGFAFAADPAQATTQALRIVGSSLAGQVWRGKAGPGECIQITTGAVMPPGLDTVAPLELVRVEGDTVHLPPGLVQTGDNRRLAGEDIGLGQAALRQGQLLTPAALGLLASLGLPTVQVRQRVRVAYFSTGDEILSLGDAVREGAVYDSNRYTVFG
ncbi:MAG: hypothetical protein RLZZ401_110, partial [Pseudomonadota bacterium]